MGLIKLNSMSMRILLLVTGFVCMQSLSAVVLTVDSNRMEAGQAFVKAQVEYKEPGKAGRDCLWDFRRLQILSEEIPVEYFIPDSSRMDIICKRERHNRVYYRQANDSLWCVGHENAHSYVDYTTPDLLLSYPFVYGDSLTSCFDGVGRYGQRIPLGVKGATVVVADAEGTLMLPGETFESALRVHTTRRYMRICDDSMSICVDTYSWYVPQNRYPVFESEISTMQSVQSDTILSAFSFYYPPDYLSAGNNNSDGDELFEEQEAMIDEIFTEAEYLPNPVESDLTIKYNLTRPASVWFTLHSSGGICLRQTQKYEEGEGQHSNLISMSGLMPGVYTLYVHVDNLILSVNIIKE